MPLVILRWMRPGCLEHILVADNGKSLSFLKMRSKNGKTNPRRKNHVTDEKARLRKWQINTLRLSRAKPIYLMFERSLLFLVESDGTRHQYTRLTRPRQMWL